MFTRAYTSGKDNLQAEPFGTRIWFNASTATVARDGMSLRPERWKLENYHRAGGPVLWAHKHDMPAIGSGEGKTDSSRLRIGVVYDQEDDFARSVESKVRRKFIRGGSVGWDFTTADGEVIKNSRAFASSLAREAFYDLSEFSMVNVPSDPHALAERQWRAQRALQSIHPGLAGLYTDQERWDSDVTEPQLRSALIEYCQQLGLDLRYLRKGKGGTGYDAAAVTGADPEDDDDERAEREQATQDELELSEQDDEDDGDGEDGDAEDEEDDDEDGDATRRLLRRSQLPDLLRANGLQPVTPALPTASPETTVDQRAAQTVLNAFATHH